MRKKVTSHTTDQEQNTSANAQKSDKFGAFDADHRPGHGDPNADLWDETLHSNKKTASKQNYPEKFDRSHHQEQGKQWANFQDERDRKREEQEGAEELSDSSEYESTSGEYESGEFDESSDEEVANKLKDLDFVQIVPSTSEVKPADGNGFFYQEGFLDQTEMAEILAHIAKGTWVNDTESKRVQIYGYQQTTAPSLIYL
jgi:hypothetical protein